MDRLAQIQSLHKSFTRLEKFFSLLMREQFSCCQVTVQQWYCLEALVAEAKSMKALAAQVALHQSTVTRIVEKLQKQGLVTRTRKPGNERSVEVDITESGREMARFMEQQCVQLTGGLLDLLPSERQGSVVEAMEEFTSLLDPNNEAFRKVLNKCGCNESCCNESCEESCEGGCEGKSQ